MPDVGFSEALVRALPLLAAGAGGVLLGVGFHGGLWWTVKRGVASPRPALTFAVSGLLRTAIVLGTVWLIGHDHWERLALCLAGFAAARPLVVRLTGRARPRSAPSS